MSLSIVTDYEEENPPSANQEEENIIPPNQREGDRNSSDQDAMYGRDETDLSPAQQACLLKWYNYLTVLLWRLGELHMLKIISFTLICVVLSNVSLWNE